MPDPAAPALSALSAHLAVPHATALPGPTLHPGARDRGPTLMRADWHGSTPLSIGRFMANSTSHWPGRTVAVVYVQGCPWRCAYCFDPSMQSDDPAAAWRWEDVVASVSARRGELDGVVFTGGEPTRQPALGRAMALMRELGIAVGLHTGGAYPARLERVLPLVNWVSLDIKASPGSYGRITGLAMAGEAAFQSLRHVQAARVPFEVTVTVDPTVHSRDEILDLADHLDARGVSRVVLQEAEATLANPDYAARLAGRGIGAVLEPADLGRFAVR
ncbi:anaerobic ribonucleoside-triphosphate reductase activating protein [Demequina litorisediminis]|uniref:Anaerobic ribonucleoside-triphosphate reductase activating protein n=1 Tax=Demequina litorisediminis TaxID=1849022 RepID=A0ABQ6IEQ6_9MICO|nr:anaerobic ribonucleoside-triphosphate reductase activating protein [Demequina litorisediminis]GMA35253.1 anaerobic ribonucleoside-triphosphate reductase activating protein [Demequina litorisediminis]